MKSFNSSNTDYTEKTGLYFSHNLLMTVKNALDKQVSMSLIYESRDSGLTDRIVEPHAIIIKNGTRNLIAWCRLRQDYRSFRLDRMITLKLRHDDFAPKRSDFDLYDFLDDPES